MAKKNKQQTKEAAQRRWQKQEEKRAKAERARQGRWTKKTAPPPNPNAETPQQDEAGPSTSAAQTEEAMEPPTPTPGPVPTPDVDEELLEFGFSLPSTPATPIGDLVPFPSTPIAPMDIGEMTPPPLVIDERSAIDELQRSSRKRLTEQILDAIDRDRSRSASRSSLERIHREVRHKYGHYTPKKAPPKKGKDEMEANDGLLLMTQLGTQKAYQRMKAHLLLFHFVPFARQHQFIGLLDEQGDEALHSVWRRLEQWWKCMPDAEQILQQLEHHFVNNWLLDTGRIDELKRNYEERKGEDDTDDEAAEEIDDECQIDVI
ncbi:hypothetical protein niasHT_000535 [Heterodera trifolii]|uniref:Uncharacterized protein n=1 Tax=Heterodera trifolii TaxID=157864 RepID=A0ABD2M4C8_9BILA